MLTYDNKIKLMIAKATHNKGISRLKYADEFDNSNKYIKILKVLDFLEDYDRGAVAMYQFLEVNGKIIPIFNVSGDDDDNWIMLDNSKNNILTLDDFRFLADKYKLLRYVKQAYGSDDEEEILNDAKKEIIKTIHMFVKTNKYWMVEIREHWLSTRDVSTVI